MSNDLKTEAQEVIVEFIDENKSVAHEILLNSI